MKDYDRIRPAQKHVWRSVECNSVVAVSDHLALATAAYEAVVFLAMRGFGSETKISCRSIMEAMFKLAYPLVKPDSLSLIIGESERNRRNRLQRIKVGKASILEEYVGDIDALIAAAEANAAKWPRQKGETGLNPDQLRERLDKLNELRVIPEDRGDDSR